MYELRELNGRPVSLQGEKRRTKVPTLRTSMGSCRQPCACAGFETGLHMTDNGCRIPIWPFFSTATEAEAREVATALRAIGRTVPAAADTEKLSTFVRAWAAANGWEPLTGSGSLMHRPVP